MEKCSKKGITLCSLIFCFLVFILIIMMIAVGTIYYYTNLIINTIDDNIDIAFEEDQTLTRYKAGEIAERFLDLKGATEYEVHDFLYMLELIDGFDVEVDNESKIEIEDGISLIKTNIKYNDYKDRLLEVVSQKLFKEEFSNLFREKDGYLYYPGNLGASGYSYDFDDAKLIEESEDVYKFKMWFVYTDVADNVEYKIFDATFIKENNNFVLDEIRPVEE